MMNPLFECSPSRRGSGSYKWDSEPTADVIPLWVADMDFLAAPVVIEALHRRVDHGVFGYTLVGDDYYSALSDWFGRRHGFAIARQSVIYTSGVVPALSAIIKALAPEDSGVIVQTPVYNCFFSSIRNNGCHIADAPLQRNDYADGTFTYSMDFDALEREASRPDTNLMLLCNPHNPAGRMWTRGELERVAEICRRNGVVIVSDEIHCELTAPTTSYVSMALVDPEAILCLSPSKAFNIAGLQIANIVCADADIRARIDRAININEVCDVNPFGVEALKAAYTPEGGEWLDALRSYLWDNYALLRRLFAEELPQCPVLRLEATYLPCVDVSAFGIPTDRLEHELVEKALVHVNAGSMYGRDGFIRVNIACPRERLAKGLRRIIDYLKCCR